jgi:hypothetical protein
MHPSFCFHSRRYLLLVAILFTRADGGTQTKAKLSDWHNLHKLKHDSLIVIETDHGDETCQFDGVTDEQLECERGTEKVPVIRVVARSSVNLVWQNKPPGNQVKPIVLGALIGAALGAGAGGAYSGSSSGTVLGRTAAVGSLIGIGVGIGVGNHQHGASRKLIYQRPK